LRKQDTDKLINQERYFRYDPEDACELYNVDPFCRQTGELGSNRPEIATPAQKINLDNKTRFG
jgi:hypothetical protein